MPITLEKIESKLDSKKSDTLVVIGDSSFLPELENKEVYSNISQTLEVILVRGIEPNSSKIVETAIDLNEKLSKLKLKRAGILGIGLGGSVAQAISARTSRFVRRTVLIDALTRVSPSVAERMMDIIEKTLPLGLPLRSLSSDYDSRPELHRIQCPTLLLRSIKKDVFLDSQFELIANRIPNAWQKKLENPILADSNNISEELTSMLNTFFEVPVKSPQKALKM